MNMREIKKVRIVSPISQVTTVILGSIAALFAGLLLSAGLGEIAGGAWTTVIVSVLVYLATRVFRGAGEPVTPARPWWKMTAQPAAGRLLAAIFAAEGVYAVLAAKAPLSFVQCAASVVLAGAYLHSSLRLRRTLTLPG